MKDKQSQHLDPVDDWIDRVITAVMRRAGKGLVDAETRAGVAPGYLRKARGGPRNIMLVKLLRICREARIDPGEIFAEVFGSPSTQVELLVSTSKTPKPAVLRQLERRLANEESKLASPPLAQTWLDELDELRYNDPARTLATVEQAISFLDRDDIPRALGIWASSARLLVRLEEGLLACREALRLAQSWKQISTRADLLRRLAYLSGSYTADYSVALQIASEAASLYGREGALPRLGQAVVDQAIFLGSLSRLEESRRAFRAGMDLLADDDHRHQFAVQQGLAVVARMAGEPAVALEHLTHAETLGALSRFEAGQLAWLRGALLADLRCLDEASEAFAYASDHLAGVVPVNAALSACDHVRALLEGAKIEEARRTASDTRRLLEPLAENRVASAAIRDLVRCEAEGHRLTTEFIEAIRTRIEAGRRRHPRRPVDMPHPPGSVNGP